MPDDQGSRKVAIDQAIGSTATLACFVFTPNDEDHHARPKKRRKASQSSQKINDYPRASQFVALFEGDEEERFAQNRCESFETAWAELDIILENILQDVNASTVEDIVQFISSVNRNRPRSYIPTCLITTGLTVTAYDPIIDSIASNAILQEGQLTIKLTPSQCTNLKTALKSIISAGTSLIGDDDDEALSVARQGVRLLNFDLQILYEYMQQHSIGRILLSFQNAESFDGNVLAEIIDVLGAWNDRILAIFVFDITISVENFQEKLPQATLRHLEGTVFEATDAEKTLDLIFRASTSPDTHGKLWIGPVLMKTILDRQFEHIQSGYAFVQAMKYAHITHYFTNPLSILTNHSDLSGTLQKEHYKALRDLQSFKRCTQKMVDNKEVDKVQSLLDDDEILHKFTMTLLEHGQRSIRDILYAVDVASKIQSCISEKPGQRYSELYIKGLSASLANSNLIRDLLLSVRKIPSDTMLTLLNTLSKTPHLSDTLHPIQSGLQTLIATNPSAPPLRSEHDVRHETLRTTIVAQKVSLSKHKSALSKQDTAYSQLVAHVDAALKAYFEKYLINPKDLVFHEIFIHDAKAPYRDAFMPTPRRAVERALSAPHDYLNCDCCEGSAGTFSPSQPATAILYQLYLESGAIINIADLWAAFNAIVGPAEDEEESRAEENSEERTLALFYSALAELKYLGMVKNSRKRTDHLAKLAWKGL